MAPLELLQTRLGLTRGDITVALFLSLAALGGVVFVEFFEKPASRRERIEMARLLVAADSIAAAHDRAGLAPVLDLADSAWNPLDSAEILDEGTDGEGRVELSLEDVAPIDPNTAPPEILEFLPGVGEKTAAKIVAARPFTSIDDLQRVHGIGPKKLEKLRPWVIVLSGDIEKTNDRARDSGRSRPDSARATPQPAVDRDSLDTRPDSTALPQSVGDPVESP